MWAFTASGFLVIARVLEEEEENSAEDDGSDLVERVRVLL